MKSHHLTILLLALSSLLAVPLSAAAKGSAAAGQQKAATCEACHGKDGKSMDPNYPNLAGQHKSYLVKALIDYRSGQRSNAIMAGFASQLSNQDIQDLATWYSVQDGLEDLSIK
jgi:cytochrome c553